MPLDSNAGNSLNINPLSDIINAGPDAFNNLFKVFIVFNGSENTNIEPCRITNFTAPKRALKTTDLDYQNITIKKIVAGSDISHEQTFDLRVDENYRVWTLLKSKMCIESDGTFDIHKTKDNECTITVETYKPYDYNSETGNWMTLSRTWVFYNCYLINTADITYGYNGADGVHGNITFIYSHFTEE